ncbi:MAG: hypothetical protein EOP34_02905 [Rickettsiales bacterium]|nr:MAG: hypothetical protein EOP34_02905 [Rickettsiales bacterium]
MCKFTPALVLSYGTGYDFTLNGKSGILIPYISRDQDVFNATKIRNCLFILCSSARRNRKRLSLKLFL